jgi:acyl-CoA thioester hydrolase
VSRHPPASAHAAGTTIRLQFPIRWDETDMAGVVFYGNYFRFFEFAEDRLFASRGHSRLEIIRDCGIWLPRVEAHAEFVRPARYGDDVELVARVSYIRTRSFRLDFEIVRAGAADEILVRGYTVVVCVSQRTFKAVPLPPLVRSVLSG